MQLIKVDTLWKEFSGSSSVSPDLASPLSSWRQVFWFSFFNSGEMYCCQCIVYNIHPHCSLSHLVLILLFNNRFWNLSDCSSIAHFSGLDKYMNDPTTTGLETTDYPIWNIDFPGVTICPNTKVKKRNISRRNSCPSSWLQASSRLPWQIQTSHGRSCLKIWMIPRWSLMSRWPTSNNPYLLLALILEYF